MPTTKPNQYLKNLDVQYISLVDAGANLKELVYKSASRSREAGPVDSGSATSFSRQVQIAKTDQDKRLVYCIVYSPDETDAHGDAMKAAEIEKAAHHFLFEGRTDQVDKQHNEQADQGRVVESYIIGKQDESFPDDPEGSWAVVIKVLDDTTWDEVKKGTISGVSLQGWCNVEKSSALGDKLKSLRDKQDKKNADLASAADRDESTIAGILSGEITAPPDEVLSGLAGELDTSLKSLKDLIPKEAAGTASKSMFEKIKDLFNASPAGARQAQKDFTQRMMHRQIRQAVWAFDEEVMDQLDDDSITDKQASVLSTVDEFRSYISTLTEETTKQFKTTDMSEKEKTENNQEKTKHQELLEKATASVSKAVTDAVEPIKKSIAAHGETLDGLQERLKAVEEAAPGSQVEKGQEEKEKTEKGFKGVSVFGSGPSK